MYQGRTGGNMQNRRIWHSVSRVYTILTALLTLVGAAWAAGTTQIYSFAGGNDGEYLDTELVMDNAGNLYGTSVQGGTGSGTGFELSPSGSGWTHTVLYNF